MTSNQSAMEDPPVCGFANWDEFYPIALQYHQSTHHGDDLVIDRIETFRRYMSEDVIEYLGGFVRLHPRFSTSEGWTQWCDNVAEMLSMSSLACDKRPPWVKRMAAKLAGRTVELPVTAKDLVSSFKKGKIDTRQFWKGLDVLVGEDGISSSEQRLLFWCTLPEDEQKRLVERCYCFDPHDEIWEKQDSEIAKLSEQKLSQIMDFSVVDERLALLQFSRKLMLIVMPALFLCIVFQLFIAWRIWRSMNLPTGFRYCEIENGILQACGGVLFIFGFWRNFQTQKELKRKKAELLIRDVDVVRLRQ